MPPISGLPRSISTAASNGIHPRTDSPSPRPTGSTPRPLLTDLDAQPSLQNLGNCGSLSVVKPRILIIMPVRILIDDTDATTPEKSKFHQATAATIATLTATNTFNLEYKSISPQSGIPEADVYKETLATIRYTGGVRYIFFPLYLTAMAALAKQYFNGGTTIPHPLMAWVGASLSLLYCVLETCLSFTLYYLWTEIKSMQVGPSAHRKSWLLWPLRFIFGLPYVVGLILWVCILLSQ